MGDSNSELEWSYPTEGIAIMRILSFFKSRTPNPSRSILDFAPGLKLSPYVGEYLAAIDRTEAFGFEAPPRLLVRKDCVDMQSLRAVLLDCFNRSPPDSMIGQTAASHFALVPLLYDKTRISFNLTIGWLVHKGKPIHQHDERLIQRFIEGNTDAWLEEPLPPVAYLPGVRDSRCDFCYEFRLGSESRRVRGSHRVPIGTRTTERLDLSPDAGRTGFLSQDGRGAVSRNPMTNSLRAMRLVPLIQP